MRPVKALGRRDELSGGDGEQKKGGLGSFVYRCGAWCCPIDFISLGLLMTVLKRSGKLDVAIQTTKRHDYGNYVLKMYIIFIRKMWI